MTEPIKLFYDKVNSIGRHGETTSLAKIFYNLRQIDIHQFEKFSKSLNDNDVSTMIIPTGRFITLISMTLNAGERSMATIDLLNDEAFALTMAEKEEIPEIKESFMNAFYLIREHYNEAFYKFKLLQGSPPSAENYSE